MNILHYTIGLPPERNGGSVVYAHSLMRQQIADGHNVYALVCGDTLFRSGKTSIKKAKTRGNLKVATLTSPTTPTLIHGVKEPSSIYRRKQIDEDSVRSFIEKNGITVLHIHTFMGLPKEMLAFIKTLGVKVIYTTHDYFGICLGYSMLLPDNTICENPSAEGCAKCNINAPSEKFLRLANSHLYHFIKTHTSLRGSVSKAADPIQVSDRRVSQSEVEEYRKLREYYMEMFSMVDLFHFNSSQTEEIFRKHLNRLNGKTISIVTEAISDRRRIKPVDSRNIQIAFMASLAIYKGFPMLKRVLTRLKEEGFDNWTLNVWGVDSIGADEDCENIRYRGRYQYDEIAEVLNKIDLTVVPSLWRETFSLVALESLSFGIPTLVSDHVGAKDVVREVDNSLIFTNETQLYKTLKGYLSDPKKLESLNRKAVEMVWLHTMENHSQEIIALYRAAAPHEKV